MNLKPCWFNAIIILLLISCKRETVDQSFPNAFTRQQHVNDTVYVIGRGQHYCDKTTFKTVNTAEMKFYARFNYTAIYEAITLENQYDINKLWGFSEGNDNHYNSARIGWRYSDGALRLFGYVYAQGIVYRSEITTASLDEDIYCSIKIQDNTYLLTVKNVTISLPRGATGTEASGFQQFPYFGGDEKAPHDIYIYVKEM